MYLYVLSTGCYSDYCETKLTHTNNYTIEEFNDMCKEVCIDLQKDRVDNYLANEDLVTNELIKRYGFQRISFLNCHIWDYSYEKDVSTTRD